MFEEKVINGKLIQIKEIDLTVLIRCSVNSGNDRELYILNMISEVVVLEGQKRNIEFWKEYKDIQTSVYIIECINAQLLSIDGLV